LTSASGQRACEHAIREFVGLYCSEPRRAFSDLVGKAGHGRTVPIPTGEDCVTTERYLGCTQKLRVAVNDRLGIEPDAA
jgi:hypothetical protein